MQVKSWIPHPWNSTHLSAPHADIKQVDKHLLLALPVLVVLRGGTEATGREGPQSHSQKNTVHTALLWIWNSLLTSDNPIAMADAESVVVLLPSFGFGTMLARLGGFSITYCLFKMVGRPYGNLKFFWIKFIRPKYEWVYKHLFIEHVQGQHWHNWRLASSNNSFVHLNVVPALVRRIVGKKHCPICSQQMIYTCFYTPLLQSQLALLHTLVNETIWGNSRTAKHFRPWDTTDRVCRGGLSLYFTTWNGNLL